MTRIPRLPWADPASRSRFPDLDAAYRRQLESMSRVRRAVAAVATSRKQLELRLDQLAQDPGTPEAEAVIAKVRRQLDATREEERRVFEASQRLQAKVSAFHAAHLAVEEAYAAAEDTAKATLAEVLGHT